MLTQITTTQDNHPLKLQIGTVIVAFIKREEEYVSEFVSKEVAVLFAGLKGYVAKEFTAEQAKVQEAALGATVTKAEDAAKVEAAKVLKDAEDKAAEEAAIVLAEAETTAKDEADRLVREAEEAAAKLEAGVTGAATALVQTAAQKAAAKKDEKAK